MINLVKSKANFKQPIKIKSIDYLTITKVVSQKKHKMLKIFN